MIRPPTAAAALLLALALAGCGNAKHDHAQQGFAAAPSPTATTGSMAGMDMSNLGDGMTASLGGYTLTDLQAPEKAGEPSTLAFTIDGPQGVQKDFTLQQTKLMHVYLVRQDLTEYQHVHPSLDPATGRWSVAVTMAKPGPYHVVTEFEALTPDGNFDDRILGSDFTVAGDYQPSTATPAALNSASVDGYDLVLSGDPKVHGGDLQLKITKDGADVTDLEPYLDSFAHITGFRSGDLTAVHVHPSQAPAKDDPNAHGGPTLTISPMFGEAGRYRFFIQFQTAGVVHLAIVDLDVTAG